MNYADGFLKFADGVLNRQFNNKNNADGMNVDVLVNNADVLLYKVLLLADGSMN